MPRANMAVDNIIRCIALIVCIFSSVSKSEIIDCDWVAEHNEACVSRIECGDDEIYIDIWEDCEVDSILFTQDETQTFDEECFGFSLPFNKDVDGNIVSLKKSLNLEGIPEKPLSDYNCALIQGKYTTIKALDVDEFPPTSNIGPLYTVDNFTETDDINQEVLRIRVTDNDFDEASSIVMTPANDNPDNDAFTVKIEEVVGNEKVFVIKNIIEIDFEKKPVYTLKYTLQSSDQRSGSSGPVEQQVWVFVKDASDMAPIWVKPVPSKSLPECDEGISAFTVTAQDRDVSIDNAIMYEITGGNEEGYFKIDPNTGEVTTNKTIDREELLDTLSFALTIKATEVPGEASVNGKDNSTQVTNIYITDINDNQPTFDKPAYAFEMDELTDKDFETNSDSLTIFVVDMDEGDNGEYTLTTSDNSQLEVVTPRKRGNSSFILRAKAIGGHFDYEEHEDNPIEFTLTATETADNNHVDTVILTITLRDINDNMPAFAQPDGYATDIYENATLGDLVLIVQATDADKNETFGTPSIRYYPGSCEQYFSIDSKTGEVTVKSELDFEKQKTVECKVQARDSSGESDYKSTDVKLTITVLDVPDGIPVLSISDQIGEIPENQTEKHILCKLTANQEDASAIITFAIDWEQSNPNNNDEIKEWFNISDPTQEGLTFISKIIALPNKLDREVLNSEGVNEIKLKIVATDEASGNTNIDDKFLTFSITDINDCSPEFPMDFETEYPIKEHFDSKGCQDGDSIIQIEPTDADEDFQDITFTISENDYLEINSTGHLIVKNASSIDREMVPEFNVTVTIEDEVQHNNSKVLTIKVKDLNDNPPSFNMSICENPYEIPEDAVNGTRITTVIATDDDEGLHGIPLYRLLNLQSEYETPFTIDEKSGEITTFKNDERFLDREKRSFWSLKIQAIDQCDNNDFQCQGLDSDPRCIINVTVTDVNDCRPVNFKILKENQIVDKITVSESVEAGTSLEYEIQAQDNDEPDEPNSMITYEVIGIYKDDTELANITFTAENFNKTNPTTGNKEYYCRLKSEGSLTHLRGTYDLKIKATDGGDEALSNNKTLILEVTDANDNRPEFRYFTCDNNSVISMEENNKADDWLNCTSNDIDFKFRIIDDDYEEENKAVELKILENSTTSFDNATQLHAFHVENHGTGYYGIKLTETIDREKGKWYNLSIQAEDCRECDDDEPRLAQIHYLMIRITNVFEFDPYFKGHASCNSNITKCEQVIYIQENGEYTANFMEAFDDDNIGGGDDDDYNDVYYKIVGLSPSDKKIKIENKQNYAIKATNLDRENEANYTVIIDTYNDEPYLYDPELVNEPQPNRLFLTVLVGDEYDERPDFDNINNVTFGSFMPSSDNIGDEVVTVKAFDDDSVNDTLVFSKSGNCTWSDSEPQQDDPPYFKFEENQEEKSRQAKLLLNFAPKGQSGYCTFPITVTDKGNNTRATEVRIFSITEDLQVPFYFSNTVQELQDKQYLLQASLTSVFDYACKIDDIPLTSPDIQKMRKESDAVNAVITHFIDEEENTVVPGHTIERISTTEKFDLLQQEMTRLKLTIFKIGDNNIPDDTDDNSLYMILLALLCGILSLVLILLGIAHHRKTSNLKRQVKALSATTFGSMSSEINKIGVDNAPVPGSNQFSGEGANPMYNLEEFTIKEDDTSSVGSGDSVLVGVEDTEDFRNYGRGKSRAPQPPGRVAPAAPFEEGLTNPAFIGRSIDQVSAAAAPSAFDGGTRTNPLLQLGEEKDLTDSLGDYQFTVKRRSSSDMEDNDPGTSALNSNFSFG